MGHSEGQIYGYFHMPCRVEIDARLGAAALAAPAMAERKIG
jgi:hypothetical protein